MKTAVTETGWQQKRSGSGISENNGDPESQNGTGRYGHQFLCGRPHREVSGKRRWYKVLVGGRKAMSSDYLQEVPYEAGMENEVRDRTSDKAPAPILQDAEKAPAI